MSRKRMLAVLLSFSSVMFMNSCTKEKMEENDEEVITTLKLTFSPVNTGSGNNLVFQFDDPDGPGGMNPSIDVIDLPSGASYNVTIQLLNKTKNPAEDITEEVKEEATSHRFYYSPSAGSNISVSNLDNDSNGVPVGITSTWTTASNATGKMKITLRHYSGTPPNKATTDPMDSPKSSTDLEVEFPTNVR